MNEQSETCGADGGCCDGAAWTAPSGTLVAAYRCAVVKTREAVDDGSDPDHPMRNPRAVYGRSRGDEGGSYDGDIIGEAATAAAEKLHSMGYRWEWGRSVDAHGDQVGAWVKCEGETPAKEDKE